MELVLLTALGVGGATVIGAVIGFIFKEISHKFSDIVLAFASGVMLAAAVLGLVLPSVEYGGKYGLIKAIIGIFAGAVCFRSERLPGREYPDPLRGYNRCLPAFPTPAENPHSFGSPRPDQ